MAKLIPLCISFAIALGLTLVTTRCDDATADKLNCKRQRLVDLSDDCFLLKEYNPDNMTDYYEDEALAHKCACELSQMNREWIRCFISEETEKLSIIVQNVIEKHNNTTPWFLWSDAELSMEDISIHVATKDYFHQNKFNVSKNLSPAMREDVRRRDIWKWLRFFCRRVADDPCKLYRYLENLDRLNPDIFFRLIHSSANIAKVYYASKACKLPMLLHLPHYKLKPDEDYFK